MKVQEAKKSKKKVIPIFHQTYPSVADRIGNFMTRIHTRQTKQSKNKKTYESCFSLPSCSEVIAIVHLFALDPEMHICSILRPFGWHETITWATARYGTLEKLQDNNIRTIDYLIAVLRIWIRCLFDPWIRDPGWVKNQDQDPGWTTLINITFPRA